MVMDSGCPETSTRSRSRRLESEVPHQANRSSEYELVSFSNPPVAEVALSAQFAADTVDIEALGSFAHHVRGALPRRRRQPMAPPLVETFDRVPQVPSIEIHLETPISLPRTWFLSESEVQLVQLQHDRLTLNWREVEQGAPYPRYGQLRERFEELFGVLGDILRDVEQSADVNLVEVTYVNPIDLAPPVGDGHPDLAKIVNRVRPRPRNAFLPEAEDAQLQARWRIPGDALGRAGPAGRLYVSATPGLRPPKNTPIYMVNVTGRVIPTGGDLDSTMEALDLAHRWVVLGFRDLTTTDMHRQWGLQEEAE